MGEEIWESSYETADWILSVLGDRQGFEWWWSEIDAEVQAEIRTEIARCVDASVQ